MTTDPNHDFSTGIPQPPAPPMVRPIYKRWWFWLILGITALALTTVVSFAAIVTRGVADVERAVESCQSKAIEQAKHPGAAEIISTDIGEVTTLDNGNRTISVEGEVDFSNGFGVPSRYTYWCGLMMILEDGEIINDKPLVLPKN